MIYPEMALITQRLHEQTVGDISLSVATALDEIDLEGLTKKGETVAVAVGSRGISHIAAIVKETLGFLQKRRLQPFIVPAMGSHGGNTSEGEMAVLASLGITESSMDVPIKAGFDVVETGNLKAGIPILMDKRAALADHIVVINRVKPHTKFRGPLGSGLTKMLTLGLSKGRGASLYHGAAVEHTFVILQDAARYILGQCSVLFGVAILEDGYKNVAKIAAVGPTNWFDAEKRLLEEAQLMMPTIPFDPIDILVIDEIGKDISGIGMDPHVTGRHRDIMGDYFDSPHVKRIFVRDLTANSDGNGNGIGLADVTTQRLVNALDMKKTYTNAITAISLEKAAIPVHFPTDRQCLDACLKTIGNVDCEAVRMVRIRNTLTLDSLLVSKALESEIASNKNLALTTPWAPLTFDKKGNLFPLIQIK